MNSLKTLVIVAVLAAVAYGVYMAITNETTFEEPEGIPPNWAVSPKIEIPGGTGTGAPLGGALSTGPPLGAVNPGFGMPVAEAGGPQIQSPGGYDAPHTAVDPRHVPGAYDPLRGPNVQGPNVGGPDVHLPSTSQIPGVASGTPPGDGIPGTHRPPVGDFSASQGATAGLGARFDYTETMARIRSDLADGKLAQAHLALSRLYDETRVSPAERDEAVELLNRVAGTVVYSYDHHVLNQAYEVRPGETLQSIAQRYQVPWQLLANINGVDDPARPAGSLKVIRGPFMARIDLAQRRMTVWLGDGRYAGAFGFEMRGPEPPLGQFVVKEKIPPDDPHNQWRTHWLDLGSGISIHGIDESGRSPLSAATTSGIGLSRQDAKDVYSILSVGSRVFVRR